MKKSKKISLAAMLFSSVISLTTPLFSHKEHVHAEEAQEITKKASYRNVMYYGDWSIWGGEQEFYPKDIAADQLTHLNYAFLDFDSNGELKFTDKEAAVGVPAGEAEVGWGNAASGLLNALQNLRGQNKNLKIGVSLGGWSKSGDFSEVAASPAKRKKLVENITKFLKYTNMDFVDIDWEYPADVREPDRVDNKNDEGTPNAKPEDKENYILLLKDIRAAIDKQGVELGKTYELSVALPASQGMLDKGIDIKQLFEVVDFANMMTYDMNGAWSATSGHHTALYGNPNDPNYANGLSVDQTVRFLKEHGAPSEKIVIGAAFYTRGWNEVAKGTDQNTPGLFQPAEKSNKDADQTPTYGADNEHSLALGDGGRAGGVWSYRNIDELKTKIPTLKEYWDDTAKAPFLYSEVSKEFFTYDNVKSINYKTQYVKEHELGGVISWMQSQDKPTTSTKRDELTKAIKNGLFGTEKLPEHKIVSSDLNVEVGISTYSENSSKGYELVIKNKETLNENSDVLSAIESSHKTIKLPRYTLALNSNEILSSGDYKAGEVSTSNGTVTIDLSGVYERKELKPGETYTFRLKSNATDVSVDHIASINLAQRITKAGIDISQQTIYGEDSTNPTPTPTPDPEDKEAPSIPTDLTASNVTETSVTLNWTASTDNKGVAGYYVYRDGQQVGQTATTNYIDKYLMAGSTYIYTVKAFDHSGNVSEHSQPLSITTLANASSSKYEAWSATNIYKAGDKVSHKGQNYQAKWWTSGEEPGTEQWGPWELID